MKKINVLFVSGIPNNKLVEVVSISPSSFTKYVMTGSANVCHNIEDSRINKKYQKLDLSLRQRINFSDIHLIFNQIAEADSHSKVLAKLNGIIQKNKNLKVINPPNDVLNTSRNRIYTKLKGSSKLIVPKTVKFVPLEPKNVEEYIKKHNFNFPVILRKTGTHGGESVKLIKTLDELYKIYDIAYDGSPFYLIEFIDYKKNGIYKKFRLVVVEGNVYIRHVIFNDKWMIHSRSREFMELNPKYNVEEKNILENFEKIYKPKIENTINDIYKKVKLDYFGIDCMIDENFNILLFEVNANMNIIINNTDNKIAQIQVDLIKNSIVKMILNKMEK